MSAATTNSGDNEMTCEQVIKGEMAEKYLLGQLTEAEQEAFEQHYFECGRCFEELQTYRALREELTQAAPATERVSLASLLVWRWWWAAAAAVVLAVGLGLWLRHLGPRVRPPVPIAVAPPTAVTQSPSPAGPSLSELTQVQPPLYASATLRGAGDEATHQFHQAMQHYVKRDYTATIPGLRAALKLNPNAADINFFLGICYLLTEQTDAAVKHLRRTAALGESPYLEEAHFYLAKAYLRRGHLKAARAELKNTIRLHGDRESEAGGLLAQLEKLSGATR